MSLGAIALGAAGGLIHAVATVTFGVDHIISGVAINILALGATQYLAVQTFTRPARRRPDAVADVRMTSASISIGPISDALGELEKSDIFFVSDLAGLLRALVTNLSLLVVLALLLFVATYFLLWRTAFGLRLRSCGESPAAAESLGVNVYRYKYIAVLTSGGLAGLGGAFLALVASSNYRDGQTGGRGYIGLAAMIFGNWRPGGLLMGSGLFGYTETLGLRRAAAPSTRCSWRSPSCSWPPRSGSGVASSTRRRSSPSGSPWPSARCTSPSTRCPVTSPA